MQEHPVLDVLSATNHGGQAAMFVCFVKLDILRIRSKNKVTCMTLKILVPQIVTTVNSLLFMLHPKIESGYIYSGLCIDFWLRDGTSGIVQKALYSR